MIFRWIARAWRWLTDEAPPKHRPPPFPHGDPPSGLDWPDDE